MRRTLTFGLACTLVTGLAWGYWSIGSVPGGNGQAQAATVGQGATPTTTVAGSTVTVSWTASTLSNGQAVNGYKIKRYSESTHVSQTILSACTGTVSALSCVESNVPSGDWVYTVTPVFSTNWLGAESQDSDPVTSDATAPANNISLTVVSGGGLQEREHGLLPRRVSGLFAAQQRSELTPAPGPASSTTAALGGTTTGWTHSPSTVSTPAGGPFVSNLFTWTAGTSSAPTEVVTGRDVSGNANQTALSFANDSTNPTGSITYPQGDQVGASVSLTLTANDGGSGLASRQIQRASAPLTGTTCGTFTSFTNLGSVNPTSPYSDTAVTNGNCYMYQYVVTDLVGNQFVAASSNVAKVGARHSAPTGTSATLTATEDTPRTLTTSDFGFGDPLENVPDTMLAVKMTTLPAAGTVMLNGTAVTTGQYVSAANIGSGLLVFQPAANGSGTPYTSLTFQVQDNGGTANGGTDLDASPNTLTFNVTAVNDSPVNTIPGSQSTTLNTARVFSTANSNALSVGDSDAGSSPIQLQVISTNGKATLSTATGLTFIAGANGTATMTFTGTQTAINTALNGLSFAPTTGYSGAASVRLISSDLGNTGSGGAKSDDDTVAITVKLTYSATISATTGLVNYYRLAETSGTAIADSKGTNTGALFASPALNVAGAISGNAAINFDKATDYASISRQVQDDLSIEFWFKSAAGTGTDADWDKGAGLVTADVTGGGGQGADDFGVALRSDGKVIAGTGNKSILSSAGGYTDNQWHHVVFTREKATGSLVLYIDGAVAATGVDNNTASLIASSVIHLGKISSGTDRNYTGVLDEVALYNTDLTAITVTNHYNAR